VKLLNKIFWMLNWLMALLLFVSYLSLYINPQTSDLPAFLGLLYPVLLAVNVFFVLWWLVFKQKFIILSLLVIGLGYAHLGRTWQLSGKELPADASKKETAKVMSYNVQLFGLYNWEHNRDLRDSIITFLETEQPDILCIQEYFFGDNGNFETTGILADKMQASNVHMGVAVEAIQQQKFGMASFLSYPIVNKGEMQFDSSNNMAIFTDFIWNEDTIRLYNIHLQSVHFDSDDYSQVDEIVISDMDREKLSGYNSIRKKLSWAFKKRASQAKEIGNHIGNSPYPVIVCGDFNDSPISYAYHQIAKDLNDSFKDAGEGFAFSYKRTYLRMRIDHILFGDYFEAFEHNTSEIGFSDHFPVYCFLRKK